MSLLPCTTTMNMWNINTRKTHFGWNTICIWRNLYMDSSTAWSAEKLFKTSLCKKQHSKKWETHQLGVFVDTRLPNPAMFNKSLPCPCARWRPVVRFAVNRPKSSSRRHRPFRFLSRNKLAKRFRPCRLSKDPM